MARLLIVEDEPQECEALKAALSPTVGAVAICTTGTAAIESFRRERADLVFCDLKLPDLDGLSVLRALKGIDPWATVILMTAYGSFDTIIQAMRLGAYDYLEKPFTAYQVQQVAQRGLDYRKQLKELALLQEKPGTAGDVPARLMALEQIKADFLALIFKEMRSPLSLLSMEMALAQQGFYGPWSDPPKGQFLKQMAKVQTQLSRLLLESFALFKAHEQHVAAASMDVRLILEETLQEIRSRCQERGIALKVRLPEAPVEGPMDREKVFFIFREILDNAVAYTPPAPPGDSIEVELAPLAQGFQFRVSDTGIGIEPKQEPGPLPEAETPSELFKPWKKIRLGLALVEHYLNLLNGKMKIQGQPGYGSSFTVTIPWWGKSFG